MLAKYALLALPLLACAHSQGICISEEGTCDNDDTMLLRVAGHPDKDSSTVERLHAASFGRRSAVDSLKASEAVAEEHKLDKAHHGSDHMTDSAKTNGQATVHPRHGSNPNHGEHHSGSHPPAGRDDHQNGQHSARGAQGPHGDVHGIHHSNMAGSKKRKYDHDSAHGAQGSHKDAHGFHHSNPNNGEHLPESSSRRLASSPQLSQHSVNEKAHHKSDHMAGPKAHESRGYVHGVDHSNPKHGEHQHPFNPHRHAVSSLAQHTETASFLHGSDNMDKGSKKLREESEAQHQRKLDLEDEASKFRSERERFRQHKLDLTDENELKWQQNHFDVEMNTLTTMLESLGGEGSKLSEKMKSLRE